MTLNYYWETEVLYQAAYIYCLHSTLLIQMFHEILKGFSVELYFLSDQQVKRKVSQEKMSY